VKSFGRCVNYNSRYVRSLHVGRLKTPYDIFVTVPKKTSPSGPSPRAKPVVQTWLQGRRVSGWRATGLAGWQSNRVHFGIMLLMNLVIDLAAAVPENLTSSSLAGGLPQGTSLLS
jgi:hypothetical protein